MLAGKSVLLRPLKYDDFKHTVKWRNNLEFYGLLMSPPFPVTEDLEKIWIENILSDKSNKNIYFGIESKNKKKLIGIVALMNINWLHRNCMFRIYFGDADSRGKGFGYESLKLITDYAFSTLNLNKISLEVIKFNTPAINLYKKFGFQQEGIMKRHYFYNRTYHDILIFSFFGK